MRQTSEMVVFLDSLIQLNIGWPKSLFGSFCKILWRNQNKLFGQPNTRQSFLYEADSLFFSFSVQCVRKIIFY